MIERTVHIAPSEFKGVEGIEYFDFEEEFMENNMRCIPMTVRFKMDTVGIKLKLDEWSKFNVNERVALAKKSCDTVISVDEYFNYAAALIGKYTGRNATPLAVDKNPSWNVTYQVPVILSEKLAASGLKIYTEQWAGLTTLQRFALLKLCRPGHENRNFPIALKEFNLV